MEQIHPYDTRSTNHLQADTLYLCRNTHRANGVDFKAYQFTLQRLSVCDTTSTIHECAMLQQVLRFPQQAFYLQERLNRLRYTRKCLLLYEI